MKMTKAERKELLGQAVVKLDEASKLLKAAEEDLLADQVNELADLADVLTAVTVEAA